MKVLLLGASGQLGWELQRTRPDGIVLESLSRAELDLCDPVALHRALAEQRADVIINAAAYTAVDRAEQEQELAFAVNAMAPGQLAVLAATLGAAFIHVSTDFVFDGNGTVPYAIDAPPAPVGAYGYTKAVGEQAVREAGGRWLILRTAWLYSAHGSNFVKTMLRLMRERGAVRVVADQRGAPTWARGLALALWRGVEQGTTGLHHWTDAGSATWFDFAVAIAEEARVLGLLERAPEVTPITTADYPTPARRPAYSVLDTSASWQALGLCSMPWRCQLRAMLDETRVCADA